MTKFTEIQIKVCQDTIHRMKQAKQQNNEAAFNKENMVYVCSKCNLRKSGMTLREFIEKAGLKRTFVETNLKKLGKTF